MPGTTSPGEVFRRLVEAIGEERYGDLAALYAEDAVVETPFQPAGPRRIEGREALAERFALVAGATPVRLTATGVVVRRTDDPEVVVAEWDYLVHHRPSGREFTVANVQVLRVRDGLIVHSRDYHDHLALAVADGRTEELVAALRAS
ncbi:nuclear transport factor 2 family protein [Kitasatospora sp. NPDC051853]|uniref:nuclear transport factor 2 family protein n=1 Tax=Kitasatospora sp. NPDC051853 TaxID=3364058 RepID=UPI0037A6BB74